MKIERNVIIKGDCIETMRKMPQASVDLIFADPPYWMRVEGVLKRPEGTDFDGCADDWDNAWATNGDYAEFTRAWLSECQRILKPTGTIWVIGGMQCIYTIGAVMQDLGFWFLNDVVWQKTNPTPNFMGTRLTNSHETLIWAMRTKNSKYTFNYKTAKELNCDSVAPSLFDSGERRQMGSIWKFPVCSGNERLKNEVGEKLHSTQKPFDLLYRVIAISSKKGDLVFDPFGGTMTTACAAKYLGRDFLTVEQNEKYIEAGKKRIDTTEFVDTAIARADFDIKPPKVTLQEMIAAGFLTVGEEFYLKNSTSSATLTADGKLKFGDEVFDIHTLAAKLKNAKAARLNGFTQWQLVRKGGKVFLDDVRTLYRKGLAS